MASLQACIAGIAMQKKIAGKLKDSSTLFPRYDITSKDKLE